MFFLFLLLMFYLNSYSVIGSEKYICTVNHTAEIESDKIYFVETPDFPRYLSKNETAECYTNFTRNVSSNEKNKKFVFVSTNIICNNRIFCESMDYSSYNPVEDVTSYTLNPTDNFAYPFLAVQGFVYYDDWGGNDCPLESIAREDPFEFTDISQIIVIQSVYDKTIPRNRSCLWQFKAPENFGFKLFIIHLNVSKNTFFNVENSKGISVMKESTITLSPILYSTDRFLKISLSKNISDIYYSTDGFPEFMAYITIIKNFWNENIIDCKIVKNGTYTYWSYWNDNIGYPNNARCNYTLTILPNTEAIVTFTKMDIEGGVDKIVYYYYENSKPSDPESAMSLDAIDKSTERKVLWEFKSDGSIQSWGFEIQFETRNCRCADPVIIVSCSGVTEAYIMDGNDDGYYCGNLQCNFTIQLNESCTENLIQVSYSFLDSIYDSFDLLRILSNNKILFEFSNSHPSYTFKNIELPAAAHNTLQVITSPSLSARYLFFYFTAKDVFITLPAIILNGSKPYNFYDLNFYKGKLPFTLLIELSPEYKNKNYSIEIVIFAEDNWNALTFFKDKALLNVLNFQDCFVMTTPFVFKCQTNLQFIALLQMKIYDGVYYIFQISNGIHSLTSEGCYFKNNIFNIHSNKKSIVAISSNTKSCKIFGYNIAEDTDFRNHNYIQDIWTSSSFFNGTINVYGGLTEKPLAAIKTNSHYQWYDLFSQFYTIELPPNTTILITLSSTASQTPIYHITKHPYKSIGTSKYYGQAVAPGQILDYGPYFEIDFNNFDIKLTLLDADILDTYSIYFIYNDTQINVTSTFQSMILSDDSVTLYSFCNFSIEHCSIRMLIETVDKVKQIDSTTNTPKITTSITTHLSSPTNETSNSHYIYENFHFIFLVYIFAMYN